MAIDTETKRRAALGFLDESEILLPTADGTIDGLDRAHLLSLYSMEASAIIHGLLSANMLAELRGERRVHPILELDIGYTAPGESGDPETTITTHRFGLQSLASVSLGLYKARIVRWSPLVRAISDREMSIESNTQFSVTIADPDREITKLIMGRGHKLLKGSAARAKLASAFVPVADWFTIFSGVIDKPDMDSTLPGWTITVRTNDRPILGKLHIPTISTVDWPNAGVEALTQPGQVVYGEHDSRGINDTGLVPCYRVDQSTFQYLVSIGRIQGIDRIYIKGNLQSYTPSLSYLERNGTIYSLLTLPATAAEDKVTVDCRGLTKFADGTGELITNPAEQLEHALDNFLFRDSRGQDYAASGQLDAPSFALAKTFLFREGATGNVVLTADQTGRDVINEFGANWQLPAFWTNAAKLAVKANDFRLNSPYLGDWPWFRVDAHEIKPMRYSHDVDSMADEIVVNHSFSEADNKTYRSLRITDPMLDLGITVPLNETWF